MLAHFGLDALCQPLEAVQALDVPKAVILKHPASLRPIAGDFVRAESGVIRHIMARQNVVARLRHKRENRVVAANIDILGIVITCAPKASMDFIDTWILAAKLQNITPVLLLNKSDLACFEEWSQAIKQRFSGTAVDCWVGSIHCAASVDALRVMLKNSTVLLVGLSGVGKSSLSNALIPGLHLKTKQLSDYSGYGVHTTTHTILHPFPSSSGSVVDAPGVREVDIDVPEHLDGYWDEFEPYLGHCQFRDCKHKNEPKCAIQKAVADGYIDPDRYRSYVRLYEILGKINPWESLPS